LQIAARDDAADVTEDVEEYVTPFAQRAKATSSGSLSGRTSSFPKLCRCAPMVSLVSSLRKT
jgi:hypothetical protein